MRVVAAVSHTAGGLPEGQGLGSRDLQQIATLPAQRFVASFKKGPLSEGSIWDTLDGITLLQGDVGFRAFKHLGSVFAGFLQSGLWYSRGHMMGLRFLKLRCPDPLKDPQMEPQIVPVKGVSETGTLKVANFTSRRASGTKTVGIPWPFIDPTARRFATAAMNMLRAQRECIGVWRD